MTQNFAPVGVQAVVGGLNSFIAASNTVQRNLAAMNNAAHNAANGQTTAWGTIGRAAAIGVGAVVGAVAAVSGAMVSIGTVSGTVAARYESTMTKVQVLSRSTAAAMGQLDDAIYEIGTTTNVSMQEAAEGAAELAKAGLSVKQQIDGALKSVVDFTIASAGEVGMSEAAITVAKGLSAFGLAGEDATRVTNALTGAAQGSVLSYKDLTRSFQQSANISALLGISIEELSTTLAVFGQAGLRGSDAGTSLKQMFIELLSPSKDALELMKQYNISLFDTEGKVRPLRDVIAGLEEAFGETAIKTGKLTEAQRANALAVIFGSDAIRSAIVSANFGTKAWDEMRGVIEQTKATDIANLFMKPTIQQLEILTNRAMAAATTFGGAFLDGFRGAIVHANLFASTISREDIKEFAGTLINIGASSVVLGRMLFDMGKEATTATLAILDTKEAIYGLSIALGLLAAPTLLGIFTSIANGAARVSSAIVLISKTVFTIGLAIKVGEIGLAMRILTATTVGALGPFAALGAVIAALTFNVGGFRDSVLRLAGTGIATIFIAVSFAVEHAANAVLRLFQAFVLLTGAIVKAAGWIIGLINPFESLKGTIDETFGAIWNFGKGLDATSDKIKELGGTARVDGASGIFTFTDSLVQSEAFIDTVGASISDLSRRFMGLAASAETAAFSIAKATQGGSLLAGMGEFGSALSGRSSRDFARTDEFKLAVSIEKQQKAMEEAAKKSRAELEKLLSTVGTAPGSFDAFSDGADKATKKLETFLQKLGVSTDATKKFLTALEFTADQSTSALIALGESALEATPEIADLGLTVAQGVAILTELGYSAEIAAAKVMALQQAFLDKKAADEAERIAKEQQQAAEEAARKFEEFRQKMIALTDTITGSLGPALKGFFDTLRNGGASLAGTVGSVLAGISGQSAQVPGDIGVGSKVAELIGTMVTNLGGLKQAFNASQGAATTAASAFAASASSLESLRAVGADLGPALENMRANSAILGAELANLTGVDLAAAGAVMDLYNALLLQAEAAKGDEQALKIVIAALTALQPEIEKFAAASDALVVKRKESIIATTESLLTNFKAVMETGLVNTFDLVNQSLERTLRDKWLKSIEEETKKKLQAIAEAVEDGLDPSEAVKRASIAMQGYHSALQSIEEESRRVAESQKILADSIEAVAIRLEHSAKEEERVRNDRRAAEREDAMIEAARLGRIQQAASLKDETQRQQIEHLPGALQAAVKRTQELTQFTQGREATFGEIFQSILNVTGSGLFDATALSNKLNKIGKSQDQRFEILLDQTANEAAARLLQDMGFSLADVEAFRLARGLTGTAGLGIPGFAMGGTVPGPLGQATPILAHGGEYVMTPTMVRAMESTLPRSIARELAAVMKGNNTSYIVNANYTREQSPSDIAMDLRALVASTK